MNPPIIFRSKLHPGCVMNRFHVVICKGHVMVAQRRDEVQREAAADGWRMVRSNHPDEGFIWIPPEPPQDGLGCE